MEEKEEQNMKKNATEMWSKKFNFWATIFFVALILLAVYRHFSLDVPFGGEGEVVETEVIDSLEVPKDKIEDPNNK